MYTKLDEAFLAPTLVSQWLLLLGTLMGPDLYLQSCHHAQTPECIILPLYLSVREETSYACVDQSGNHQAVFPLCVELRASGSFLMGAISRGTMDP